VPDARITGAYTGITNLTMSGNLTVDTNTLYVDSANNRVGIGTSSPSETLEINSGTGNIGAKLVSTDNLAVIAFKDNSTTDVQYLGANGDNLVFHAGTSPSERMRIDSSGNLLVGTTNVSPANGNVQGIALKTNNAQFSANANNAITLNRMTDDGNIIKFKKAGTDVGSIGTVSSNLVIGTDDTGFYFNGAAERILPINTSTFALRDAAIDLGATNARYKDLYLSNSVRLKGATRDFSIQQDNYGLRVYDNDGASERLRIDAAGNLLVGKTSSSFTTAGIELNQNGVAGKSFFARSGGEPISLNRLSSDGDILTFYKDSTLVGSIGSHGGTKLYIGSGAAGLRFTDGGTDLINPYNTSTNADADGTVNLGYDGGRFKDLYLSGGVYLGGTGSANKLDDYEEGTWTPVLRNSDPTTGTVVGTSNNNSSYVKIGNLVHANLYIQRNDASSLTNQLFVTNLPFTSDNYPAPNGSAWFDNTSSDWRTFSYTSPNSTFLYFIIAGNSNDALNTNNWDNSRYIYCSFTYRTA
jgi:hypothetical protein